MKRVILLFGGSGGRMAEALLFSACAGILPEEELSILLCDSDGDGMHGATQLHQELLDYQQIWASRTYVDAPGNPFRTEMHFQSWCDPLPMQARTLTDWLDGSDTDSLIAKALFDASLETLDLRQGFHDHPELARLAFSALLWQAEHDENDAMHSITEQMRQALDAGEEVRVVLAGSLCGGTGAAGMACVAAYLREKFAGQELFRMGGVVMLPCAENESPERAKKALGDLGKDGTLEAVCLLGLPQSVQSSGGNDLPRLTDWLGVYCMDVLLHRPTWLRGVFTVQAENGRADWSLFGKGEARYRQAFGGLMKAALLWQREIAPTLEKALQKDNALKSGLTGWYPHFFRGAQEDLADVRADVAAIDRLTKIALLWMAGVVRSLPLDMRYASILEETRRESRTHYESQLRRAGELAVMRFDLSRSATTEDEQVHRGEVTATENDVARSRIHAMEQTLLNEESVQTTFNRQMGGDEVLRMVTELLAKSEKEHTRMAHDHAEAERRIAQAEQIVKPSERFRIDDARTKLQRMERHQAMVDGMYDKVKTDAAALRDGQLRFMKPAMASPVPENGLFLQEAMDRFLRGEQESKKELAAWYPALVSGGRTADLRQTMKQLGRAQQEKEAPAVGLLLSAMEASMQEENA